MVNSMATVIFLTIILLNSLSVASATGPSIKVNVRAKAEGRNLTVSGKVFLRGLECEGTIYVSIRIIAKGPSNEGTVRREVSGEIRSNSVTILPYEYTFEDFVNEKGIYEIEVTAECGRLSDTAFFKFDPPTGGTPGVPC